MGNWCCRGGVATAARWSQFPFVKSSLKSTGFYGFQQDDVLLVSSKPTRDAKTSFNMEAKSSKQGFDLMLKRLERLEAFNYLFGDRSAKTLHPSLQLLCALLSFMVGEVTVLTRQQTFSGFLSRPSQPCFQGIKA